MSTLAYNLIKAESERVGWPRNYETDLDIDSRIIQHLYDETDHPGVDHPRFGWGLRENGTHVVFSRGDILIIESIWSHEITRWYYFDGYMLHEMNATELCDILRE